MDDARRLGARARPGNRDDRCAPRPDERGRAHVEPGVRAWLRGDRPPLPARSERGVRQRAHPRAFRDLDRGRPGLPGQGGRDLRRGRVERSRQQRGELLRVGGRVARLGRSQRDADSSRAPRRLRGGSGHAGRNRRSRRRRRVRRLPVGRVQRRQRPQRDPRRGPEDRRALLRPARRARHPRPRLRHARRGDRAAGRRPLFDRGRARARRDLQPGIRPLGVPVPDDDGDGARDRRRLRPLHRVALPGGASGRSQRARRDRGHRSDCQSRRPLQRAGVRTRDVGALARSRFRPPQPRRRRAHGRAGRSLRSAHAGAGTARAPGRSRERAPHPDRRSGGRFRRPRGTAVVRDCAGRDAAPGSQPRPLRRSPPRRRRAGPRPAALTAGPEIVPGERALAAGLRRARGGVRHRHGRLGDRGRRG